MAILRNIVRNVVRNVVYSATSKYGQQIVTYFARFFNEVTKYIQIGTDCFVKDTESTHDSTRVTEPTIVLLGDGTASMQITEADYPTVDFDTVVFSYVTEDNVGKLITGTRSAGVTTIVFPSEKVSNVKMIPDADIPSEYSALNVEKVTNGDFATGDLTSWSSSDLSSNVDTFFGQTNACELTATGGITVYVYQSNIANIGKRHKFSFKYYLPSTNTNVDQINVHDNIAALGSSIGQFSVKDTWVTVELYLQPSNDDLAIILTNGGLVTGINIGDKIYIADVNYEEVGWADTDLVKNLNLTGTQAGVSAQWLCDEGAGEGTNVTLFDRLSGNTATLVSATLPDVWSTSLIIPSVQEQLGWNVADGTELSGALEEDVRIPINPTNQTLDVLAGTPTYTGIASRPLVPVKRNCVLGDGTAYLAFTGLPTYDAITVIEDGVEVSISLISDNWTPTTGKYYNDIIFTNASVEVGRLPLEDYPAGTSPTGAITFADKYGNITATLTSGTLPDNLSSCDGKSDLAENGYAVIDADTKFYPANNDKTGYIGLTGGEAGYKAYPAGNTQDAVQQYQMIPSQANIAIDANNVFFDATPAAKDVSMNDIAANDYIEVTKDSDSNVTDLKILE